MKIPSLAALAALLLSVACGEQGFYSDSVARRRMAADFNERRAMLDSCGAVAVVDSPELTRREREALQFLYAYMPLGDALNFDGSFFLRNVRLAEEARQTMPWGEAVPECLYRHFVLPVRVNNEIIDNAREVFYCELADRVRSLTMAEAILEINHWCHEKVVYAPTDSRTASPLALISAAAGRCGEESAFLVTALRAVGIPARQVYTPSWAHTDDNHAWVEAWTDGSWHFLGACEPEPVLDLGWFNGPASRGMIFNANVFGPYDGHEEVLWRNRLVTEINVTDNYAPTAKLHIRAVDVQGNPVTDARIDFDVYNYSRLSSIDTQTTDGEGYAHITAGLGDLVVWGSRDGRYGIMKASVGQDSVAVVVLDRQPGDNFHAEFHIVPPVERVLLPSVTEAQRKENTRRMAVEDSVRNAFVSTFATPEEGRNFARAHGLDPERTAPLLTGSKGNRGQIESFLAGAARNGKGDGALSLLEVLLPKDLHDTPCEVLEDHLYHAEGDVRTVVSPRVGMEPLSAYRAALQEALEGNMAATFRKDPAVLVDWCRNNLRIVEEHNLRLVPILPCHVWRARLADRNSRDLFFVAACRSLGIPAWRDPITGRIHYRHNDRTCDVDFETPRAVTTDYGILKIAYTPTVAVPALRYYNHFTLSRLENGHLRPLHFDDNEDCARLFGAGVRLEAGDYALVCGTRLGSGDVLADLTVFTIRKEERTDITLRLPEERRDGSVCGMFNPEVAFTDMRGGRRILREAMEDDWSVVGILGAGEEPTNHALHDIAACGPVLERLGYPLVLLFESEENAARFHAQDFPSLPATVTLGIDTSGEVRRRLSEGASLAADARPLLAVTDGFGRIRYISSGYSIGLGERLVKELSAEEPLCPRGGD